MTGSKASARYQVLRQIGAGGMGTVELAEARDGSLVVLKRALVGDPAAHRLLREEARVGALVVHDGLVSTLDLYDDGGGPVLVLEYVEGMSLHALRRRGALPAPVVAAIGSTIASAMAALHGAVDERGRPLGILHRDISAGNVIVGVDGRARLIDLGLARSSDTSLSKTATDVLKGTLRYMAPEQLQGDKASSASDVWALAVVLAEAALGAPVFRGTSPGEVIASIVLRPFDVDALAIDAPLRTVLAQALRRNPAERVAASEFAAALAPLGNPDDIPAIIAQRRDVPDTAPPSDPQEPASVDHDDDYSSVFTERSRTAVTAVDRAPAPPAQPPTPTTTTTRPPVRVLPVVVTGVLVFSVLLVIGLAIFVRSDDHAQLVVWKLAYLLSIPGVDVPPD